MNGRVYWTDAEAEQLLHLLATMRLNYPEPPLVQLLNRAQEQLPAHRRRRIDTIASVKWLVDRLKPMLREQTIQVVERTLPGPSVQDVLETVPTDKLAETLTQRHEAALELIQARLRGLEGYVQSRQPSGPRPDHKQRIAVVSVYPAQAHIVRDYVGDVVDLRFVPHSPRPVIPAADVVIVMTKFVSHSVEAQAVNTGARVVRCDGGLGALAETILRCV